MISGVRVPSLVTLPLVDALMYLLLLLTELGGWRFSELFDVAADVDDLGWVVVVISDPIEARPLSEDALQLPLDECGSSLLPPVLRNLRCAELSRSFTVAMFMTGMLMLDFSLEEQEGFRSCKDFRSLSMFRLRFSVTVSY